MNGTSRPAAPQRNEPEDDAQHAYQLGIATKTIEASTHSRKRIIPTKLEIGCGIVLVDEGRNIEVRAYAKLKPSPAARRYRLANVTAFPGPEIKHKSRRNITRIERPAVAVPVFWQVGYDVLGDDGELIIGLSPERLRVRTADETTLEVTRFSYRGPLTVPEFIERELPEIIEMDPNDTADEEWETHAPPPPGDSQRRSMA